MSKSCIDRPHARLRGHRRRNGCSPYRHRAVPPGLYPGATLLSEPEVTRRWSQALGIGFHEVRVEPDKSNVTSLFRDLQVSEAGRIHTLRRGAGFTACLVIPDPACSPIALCAVLAGPLLDLQNFRVQIRKFLRTAQANRRDSSRIRSRSSTFISQ
ncbi:hypothetical protein [Kitasatospora paranensis]|uniref:YxiG-like protein n=1 Tax=Kitasatospora paranensis TaxID=258053 RepID=UPI003CD0AEF1